MITTQRNMKSWVDKRYLSSTIIIILLIVLGISVVVSVSIGQIPIPYDQSFWILVEHITG